MNQGRNCYDELLEAEQNVTADESSEQLAPLNDSLEMPKIDFPVNEVACCIARTVYCLQV